jgi:hypothetical protein
VIITNSSPDTFYYNQLLAFLTSLKTNSPQHKIYVFLANYLPEKESFLRSRFPNYHFENRELKAIDDRGFSFIQFRASLIEECFETYQEHVAWIDTDVIVRKDLTEFLDVAPNQLKILYRGDDKPDKVKINAGIFNIGCSIPTLTFICDWRERIRTNAKWGMGQLEFWNAFKDYQDEIELIKMSDKFNDLGGSDRPNAFDDDSVMWHCKKAHFNHPKFQKEFKYYLNIIG